MKKVLRSDIVDYQTYNQTRDSIRSAALRLKEPRRIHVGPHLTFLFENTETIRYQIQEMMRTEQIVREADILHEIETYNEVLGDSKELGCTLLIEIENPIDRDLKLTKWRDLPKHLYMVNKEGVKIRPSVDSRQSGDRRLSSVQYLKFQLPASTPVALGCDFSEYQYETPLSGDQKQALAADLSS
ncbi:DUF3501 family protein [bacterium]|jgi:hypothetical protein|nr:DUF3501 family protein [bacterium]